MLRVDPVTPLNHAAAKATKRRNKAICAIGTVLSFVYKAIAQSRAHVISPPRPSPFLRATLKTWEWPGDEATWTVLHSANVTDINGTLVILYNIICYSSSTTCKFILVPLVQDKNLLWPWTLPENSKGGDSTRHQSESAQLRRMF